MVGVIFRTLFSFLHEIHLKSRVTASAHYIFFSVGVTARFITVFKLEIKISIVISRGLYYVNRKLWALRFST